MTDPSSAGRLRSWVACLALICFGAGAIAGALFERQRSGADEPADGPFQAYRELFEDHFELSPERQRLFAQIVRHYQRDLEDVRERALEDSMGSLEPDLVRLGLRYRDLIRNHVLPEAERTEFDRLAAATPWQADTSRP